MSAIPKKGSRLGSPEVVISEPNPLESVVEGKEYLAFRVNSSLAKRFKVRQAIEGEKHPYKFFTKVFEFYEKNAPKVD